MGSAISTLTCAKVVVALSSAAKKSLSSYVVALAQEQLRPRRWSKAFLATYGSWSGKFPDIAELPFETRDPL